MIKDTFISCPETKYNSKKKERKLANTTTANYGVDSLIFSLLRRLYCSLHSIYLIALASLWVQRLETALMPACSYAVHERLTLTSRNARPCTSVKVLWQCAFLSTSKVSFI